MTEFNNFGLAPALVQSLSAMNFTTPTPIQAQAIPLVLSGRDVLGSAQTGTGKTGAFAIPLINMLLENTDGMALVLSPTRELSKQIMDAMQEMIPPKSGFQSALLIGGEHMGRQFDQLRRNPRLIVGTPGRVHDHLRRGSLKLEDTRFLVLDETDRMLDMGFSIQLDEIAEYMPTDGSRQTMMFSATLPHNIMRMADKYLSNPERIEIGASNSVAQNVQQDVMHVQQDKKYKTLLHELNTREGSIIVFVNTKRESEQLAKKLKDDGLSAEAIHGDLRQFRREKIVKKLRADKFRILVATDVVARGLDVPHIAHVINYDLPMMPEDYIHRIGRTARAGAVGQALCLVSPRDSRRWSAILRLIDPENDNNAKKGARNGQTSRRAHMDQKRQSGKKRDFGRNDFGKKDFGGKKFAGKKKSYDDGFGAAKGKDSYKPKQRDDWSDRPERSERPDRGDRFERQDRKMDRGPRDGQFKDSFKGNKSKDGFKSKSRVDWSDRPARSERSDRSDWSDRPARGERSDRPQRGDRFERTEKRGEYKDTFKSHKSKDGFKPKPRGEWVERSDKSGEQSSGEFKAKRPMGKKSGGFDKGRPAFKDGGKKPFAAKGKKPNGGSRDGARPNKGFKKGGSKPFGQGKPNRHAA